MVVDKTDGTMFMMCVSLITIEGMVILLFYKNEINNWIITNRTRLYMSMQRTGLYVYVYVCHTLTLARSGCGYTRLHI